MAMENSPKMKSVENSLKKFQRRVSWIGTSSSRYREIAEKASINGGVGRFRLFTRSFWCISEPALVRYLLVDAKSHLRKGNIIQLLERILGRSIFTAEGAEWDALSESSKITLGKSNSRYYEARVVEIVGDWIDHIQSKDKGSMLLNLRESLYDLSMNIMTSVLLGALIPEDAKKQVSSDHEWIRLTVNRRLGSSMIAPTWVPSASFLEIYLRQRRINTLLSPWITKARKKSNEYGRCLLSDLDSEIQEKTLCPFSDKQNADFVKTLFFTGIRTTSITLEWILLYLVDNPDYLNEIQKEVDQTIGTKRPTESSIGKMKCMERFIREVMRMAPVAHTHVRRLTKSLEYKSYQFKKGDVVLLSVFGVNRNPDVWEDPDKFDPERYRKKEAASLLFPYGLGQHTCPGQFLAHQSVTIALVSLLQRFRIEGIGEIRLTASSFVLLEPAYVQHVRLTARYRD